MIYVIVFLTGLLGLAFEIAIGRLFTPYFGSSIYPWAAAIGITLLAFSVGYYASPKILKNSGKKAGFIYLGAAIWIFILTFFSKDLLNYFALQNVVAGVFEAALFFVFIPCFLWGLMLPYFVESFKHRSALILALSTLGSLGGVFLSSLILIPSLGLQNTFISLSIISAVISFYFFALSKTGAGFLFLSFFLLCSLGKLIIPSKHLHTYLDEADTVYQSYEIQQYGNTEDTDLTRVMLLEGFPELAWKPNVPLSIQQDYYWLCSDASFWIPTTKKRKILLIGLGGGMMPLILEDHYRKLGFDFDIDIFELDGKLTHAAKRYLPFSQVNVPVQVGDGRVLLCKSSKVYDSIILDTYLGPVFPEHLMTVEFFQLLSEHLSDEGLLIINTLQVFSSIGLDKAFTQEIKQSFASVFSVDLPHINRVVVATKNKVALEELRGMLGKSQLKELAEAKLQIANGADDSLAKSDLMTDNLNPFNTKMHLLTHQLYSMLHQR